jgi:hypothetical protein
MTERPSYSGRLLLRMPRTLHAELAQAAEREGTSLNQLIVGLLSRSIGGPGKQPNEGGVLVAGGDATGPVASARGSRGLRIALVLNLAVVLLAAATAVTLLIVAWRHGF